MKVDPVTGNPRYDIQEHDGVIYVRCFGARICEAARRWDAEVIVAALRLAECAVAPNTFVSPQGSAGERADFWNAVREFKRVRSGEDQPE